MNASRITTLSSARDAASSIAASLLLATVLALLAPNAEGVPSYSRRYGMECSGCHTMWGSLNAAGATFRLSGYRAIFGKDLTPISEDVEIAKGVTIPSTLPLSFVTGVGVDSRTEKREVTGTNSSSVTSQGTSLALEDASIFMTSPIGSHFSAFVEFPMYETRAWEFTPTGNFEARYNTNPGHDIKFGTESPAFEVAKFWWNNLFGESMPRDSVNGLFGITHLPTAYPAGKVRLAVNQYLIYERTALSLISPRKVDDVVGGEPNDFLFRLSEPQIMAEMNGMFTFGAPVTETSKRETPWAEYHLGVTNGSNNKINKSAKDVYGRFVVRYYNQSLGVFFFESPDQYYDSLRTSASIAENPNGIMSGAQQANRSTRWGPDFTLSLAPLGYPISLENQFMWNRESNPTGFGQDFKWHGGFHQLNWQPGKNDIFYARYDWLRGDAFDDTGSAVNGVTGITRSTPREKDGIIGWQHLFDQNIKLIAEYRYHKFEDNASGAPIEVLSPNPVTPAKLTDYGFTLRIMLGF